MEDLAKLKQQLRISEDKCSALKRDMHKLKQAAKILRDKYAAVLYQTKQSEQSERPKQLEPAEHPTNKGSASIEQINKLSLHIKVVVTQLKKKEQENKDLRVELEISKNKKRELKRDLQALKEQKEELGKTKKSDQDFFDSMQKDLDSFESERLQYLNQIDEQKKQIAKLKYDNDLASSDKKTNELELKAKFIELDFENIANLAVIKQSNKSIKGLQSLSAKQSIKISKISGQLAALEEALSDNKISLSDRERQIESLKKRLEQGEYDHE